MLKKDYPDNHDAELVLRLYELRREGVMRESRATVSGKYWPKTGEEAVAVLKGDHPLNAPFRQVVTYWEMVYGMVKWGILHAEFALESSSEGLYVFAKAASFLPQIRQTHPSYFVNAEWVVNNTDAGRRMFERYRERVRTTLETK